MLSNGWKELSENTTKSFLHCIRNWVPVKNTRMQIRNFIDGCIKALHFQYEFICLSIKNLSSLLRVITYDHCKNAKTKNNNTFTCT